MSLESEDTEPSLKELVTKALEKNGVLGKLQAQLRASIFLTLEEEFKERNIPILSKRTQQILSSPVGKLGTLIIQDFLQCLGLEFSLSVFGPESNFSVGDSLDAEATQSIFRELNFDFSNKRDGNYPILLELINGSNLMKSKENKKERDDFIMNAFDKAYSEMQDTSVSEKSTFGEADEISTSGDSEKCTMENSNETDNSESSTLNSDKILQSHSLHLKGNCSEEQSCNSDAEKSTSEKSKSLRESSSRDINCEELRKVSEEILIGENIDNRSRSGFEKNNLCTAKNEINTSPSNKGIEDETPKLNSKSFSHIDTGQDTHIIVSSAESSEVAEEYDDNISDLLSSTSLNVSQNTQDISALQITKRADFEESL